MEKQNSPGFLKCTPEKSSHECEPSLPALPCCPQAIVDSRRRHLPPAAVTPRLEHSAAALQPPGSPFLGNHTHKQQMLSTSAPQGQPVMAHGSTALPRARGAPSELRGTSCQAAACSGQPGLAFPAPPPRAAYQSCCEQYQPGSTNKAGGEVTAVPTTTSQSQRIKAKQEPPAPIPSIPSTVVSIAGNQSFPLPRSSCSRTPVAACRVEQDESSHSPHTPRGSTTELHSTGLITAASSQTAAHSQHLRGRSSWHSVVLPLQHPPAR